MKRFQILVFGILFFSLSTFGIVYSVRACLAQIIYHNAKYGRFADSYSPHAIARRFLTAKSLYPYNYYFCILAGEHAYYGRKDLSGKDDPELIKMSKSFCEDGLKLNHYRSQLRMLKTNLLTIDSPAEAANYWAKYVEWDFWVPFNHYILLELYMKSGNFADAIREMEWLKGSQYMKQAEHLMQKSWENEMVMPESLKTSSR